METTKERKTLNQLVRPPAIAGALASALYYIIYFFYGDPSTYNHDYTIYFYGILIGYCGIAAPSLIAAFVAYILGLSAKAARIVVSGSGMLTGFAAAYMYYSSFACGEFICTPLFYHPFFISISIFIGGAVALTARACFSSFIGKANAPLIFALSLISGVLVFLK
ncbi:hypothetical protein FHX37_3790 [Haloactinospora alba]|uniref:Uncharacterized protein n=1 Tax=Haloactinospora alba TaxID=405555 RepID=A0A543N9D2_9ACTN|nr:hypothetical protein [Haloactinospora alba]TQN28445.1 hypothetical protein FHX37_3790 [Haloactinospora alba]